MLNNKVQTIKYDFVKNCIWDIIPMYVYINVGMCVYWDKYMDGYIWKYK